MGVSSGMSMSSEGEAESSAAAMVERLEMLVRGVIVVEQSEPTLRVEAREAVDEYGEEDELRAMVFKRVGFVDWLAGWFVAWCLRGVVVPGR
jgi:hypothetical protein